jgi:DUF4097 and DUF4098 domain-containing protein YvlB
MRTVLRVGVMALACAPLTGCVVVGVDSQGQIVRDEKRFSVEGRPDLHLATFDGAIEVRSTEGPQVIVEIEKRGPTREAVDELRVESSQNGSRIDVEVKRPSRESLGPFGLHVNSSAKLIVSVPRRSDLVARTGDGGIRVEGIEGRLELRTGDGAIHVSDIKGELALNTGDGAINVDHAEGRLTLQTGDGGVNVEGNLSVVRMHTGDGSIVYRADTASRMDDDWEISTGDGSVSIYLPSGFNADLDAHTGDGRIRNDLDIAVTSTSTDHESKERDRRTLRGRLGQGGRRLKVQTGDGSITLKAR